MGRPRVGILAMTLLLTLSGCGMTRASQRPPAPIAPVQAEPPEALAPKKGSVWQTTDRNTLFLDNKARNVGDLVTVLISETSNASNQSNTKLSREGKNEVDLGGLFGATAGLQNRGNKFLDDAATMKTKFDHNGSGATSRGGTFTGAISCSVTEVLSNGTLRIEGRRDITLNNENQYIVVSGLIRSEDISSNNTVKSTQIADARLEFSGEGDIADQQEPSFFNKFFSTFRIL
ncbi:MAG: flagellar basal body L-ring protein FlgH [Magnetococcales bacterium]|nr:flagellar basal body L-ring protein FlgH [Magnetococcales bacterium]